LFSLPVPLPDRRGAARDLRGPGKYGRRSLHPGLRQEHRRADRSYREETPLPLPPRLDQLFHRHGWLQFPLSALSELRDFPAPPRSPGNSRAGAAGCRSISYTYTEPTIFYEYAFDTAVLARQAGLGNVFVTNGYITPEALEHIAPYLDAANIDLKGFSEKFYREVAGATLAGVLDSLKVYKRLGIWIEVTTLIIPGHNDDEADLKGIARFIAEELGCETPWHVTAFYPTYKLLDRPPTPVSTLRRARQIGLKAGLRYVYEGNIPGEGGENTLCPACRRTVIERRGFRLGTVSVRDGRCGFCGVPLDGVW
jgi:pyruvate formate lyase activating enzyme